MNKRLLNAFMFAVGAAIGSAVTWKVVKTRYEQIVQEEIDSVKEEYASLMTKMKKKLQEEVGQGYEGPQDADAAKTEEENHCSDDAGREATEHEREIIDYNYISSSYRTFSKDINNDYENDEEGDEGDYEVPYINGPYVISPEDFTNSPPGYNAQALDYFSDGILADSWGVELDLDETIGEDAVNHFGEYADDVVYVRNERTEIDYEVTKDPRTYEEVVRTSPNPYYGKYEN